VDPKRIIGQKWRAEEEEERHKGSLAHKKRIRGPLTRSAFVKKQCSSWLKEAYRTGVFSLRKTLTMNME
jgi:hypothetical protein